MIIDQLPLMAAPTGTDELPLERGTTTYKATLESMVGGKLDKPTTAADLNVSDAYSGSPVLYYWNSSTLNSPYSEGIAAFTQGFCISCVGSGGAKTQIAVSTGQSQLFIRRFYQNAWTAWERLTKTVDLPSVPTVQSGTVQASVTSNTNVTTSVTFPTPFTSAPAVSVNFSGNITSTATLAAVGYSVRNVTATGFDLVVGIAATSTFSSIQFRWTAIGS